ncbi:WS/DGAT/MGAT family O-acyltransferase [Arenicella xantha]|uniref:diacylglycerol O-acyltransferase n=1 Tax=Arenicella xantha TaxID=644221 RepID=A0A395JQF2_9GAMM|nr:wax ester/triacylglycerol synthase family O-acyltransferase [Arenicella xantha]RBP50950.1 WS/DGAT/MGAT family acyltransferase [Arenicella xantha]
MQQLTGLDASFLYLETASSPMHIGGLTIYDPASAPGGLVGFKQIMANVAERAHKVASMNNVLLEVPMRLDHPYWRSDGEFDPEFHIRHIALPKPGDWRQLCIQVARLHARPLDRARPLWEMYIVEGLDNIEGYPPGCFALVTKMHHAAIDGASGIEIAATIHDLSPDYRINSSPQPVTRDRQPTYLELIWRSQLNSLRTPKRVFEVAKNTVPGFAKMVAGVARGRLKRVTDIPRTRFNTNVSPHRAFDAVEVELSDIKQIKDSIPGVTVNDVALAICGGGLRKYLESKGELPQRSMVAMAPINIRTQDKLGTAGNQVSQMTVRIGSNIADPMERLIFVNQGTRNAKELTNAIGAKTMTDYAQFIPSTLTASAAKLYSRLGMANRIKPAYNCVITNVPGPQVPLYFTGAKMMSSFALGPPIDGMGLFHGLGSYCGKFNISISACREMMPDPAFYAECLRTSFEELHGAAIATQGANKQSATPPVTNTPKKPASRKKKATTKKQAKKASKKLL